VKVIMIIAHRHHRQEQVKKNMMANRASASRPHQVPHIQEVA